jgi:hypothetical protein
MGPAQPYLYPPPLNFTVLKDRGVSGGILYYQIMNGITGPPCPLQRSGIGKIWDVGITSPFISSARPMRGEPRGIAAAMSCSGQGETMMYYCPGSFW